MLALPEDQHHKSYEAPENPAECPANPRKMG